MRFKRHFQGCLAGLLLAPNFTIAQEQELTVNFRDTDLKEVISFVADVTGKTIIVDPLVNGRVMVVSEQPLDADDLYELFLSVLEVHNFVAIENNGVVRVLPKAETRMSSVPLSNSQSSDAQSARLVTQVIKVNNVSATQLLPVLRPMVPPEAHLAAYDPSNSIVITDSAANAARIRDLIEAFDRSVLDSSEVINLTHANAQTMADLVQSALLGDESNAGVKIANVTADARANRLLVTGDPMARQRVRELVAQLDTAVMAESNSRVIYLEYALAADVATSVRGVVGGAGESNGRAIKIEPDEQTNALILTGEPTELATLEDIIKRLDVERSQVLVEAIIVELQDTAGKELGVQWLFADTDNGVYGSSATPGSDASIGNVTAAAIGDSGTPDIPALGAALSAIEGQTLGFSGINGTFNFNVLINALQEENGANILSTPSVLTMDNREAIINVGQNVPFVTGSYTSQGSSSNPDSPFQTIEREDVGIKLTVTPRVNGDNRIVLDILQEVSSLSGNTGVDASDLITNTRDITTQVIADNGGVVVLGGLIQDDLQQYEQKVPFLGDIPLLGRLFRSNGNRLVKTNLLVFIRATVIENSSQLQQTTEGKYEYIRERQHEMPNADPTFLDDMAQPVLPEYEQEGQ
ncbi:type II secretion system secretin GspD [uncultured Umboniibacter sp.]|uniref:type II secretion system secretin GspD n=1 Tax=uncultured Umboniibacter sp. TaxID=1798917 RepID=UPI0026130023|nr:type II secretion system secretin GspD [uncultured Umboniibacter sp.]